MTHDDGKTDELFAKLSGSAGTPGSERDKGIAALREALRGQIDRCRSQPIAWPSKGYLKKLELKSRGNRRMQ